MSSSAKSKKLSSKLSKYMKAPIRIMIMARDFYIRSMFECADHVGYGAVVGCPTGQVIHTLPRSFSNSSSTSSTTSNQDHEDCRELLSAVSTRSTLTNRFDLDQTRTRQQSQKSGRGRKNYCNSNISSSEKLPRRVSDGIGRIDEDEPCDFQDEFKVTKKNDHALPRSRSYAFFNRGKFKVF